MGDRNWLGFSGRVPRTEPVDDTERLRAFTADLHNAAQHSDHNRRESQPHRIPRLSRISSYIGLGGSGKQHSPPRMLVSLDHDDPTKTCNGFSNVVSRININTRDGDVHDCYVTWHNPNLTQILETVSCTIMSNGVSEPIPRHLNGSICSMIEEFRVALSQLQTLQGSYKDLQQTRAKETQEFAAVANEWTERETGFKTEIKRLEKIIASSEDGVAPVILARSGSVVNRKGKEFHAKVNRLSKTEDEELKYDKNQRFLEGEQMSDMRNFQTTNVSSKAELDDGRMVLDHNDADIILSGRIREMDAVTEELRLERQRRLHMKKMVETNRIQDKKVDGPVLNAGDAQQTSPRKSDSSNTTTTASSAEASHTHSSGSLITQGILAQRASQAPVQVTPHTTPPRPEPGKETNGPVETIQELLRLHGGRLPDEAITDNGSEASPVMTRQHRAFSFKVGDDDASKNMDNDPDSSKTPVASKYTAVSQDAAQSPTHRPVTAFKPDEVQVAPSSDKKHTVDKIISSPESSKSPGGSASRSAFTSSEIMQSMGHNLMKGPMVGPRPARKVQSGGEPILDQATKDAARREHTIMSHMATRHTRPSVLTAADVAAIDGMRLPFMNHNYQVAGDPANGYRPAAPRRYNGPLGPAAFGPRAPVQRAATDIAQGQGAAARDPAALARSTSQPRSD